MEVRRKRKPNSAAVVVGCLVGVMACGVIGVASLGLGAYLFRDQILGAGLEAAGLVEAGDTETVIKQEANKLVPTAPPLTAPAAPTTVAFVADNQQLALPPENVAAVSVGQDETGRAGASVQATERELLDLCRQHSPVCSAEGVTEQGVSIRNASVDLRHNTAVLYADVKAEDIPVWQRIGVVLGINGTWDGLVLRGVDINGTLYTAPPDDQLGALLAQAEADVNAALREFVMDADGQQFRINRIRIDEGRITVDLR